MKILGVNFSHNCSFAYIENNILKEYYEEDRFNKEKNFRPPHPFFVSNYEYQVLKKFKNITFDVVALSSSGKDNICYEKLLIDNILSQVKCNNVKFYNNQHHIHHVVCGFYFSNFDKAIGVICDGAGERFNNHDKVHFRSVESIYEINKKEIKCFFQHFTNRDTDYFNINEKIYREEKIKENKIDLFLSNAVTGGAKYEKYRAKAGFSDHQEGQLMGIAAYKSKKTNLNKEVLEIANKAQEETLEDRIKLIKKAITYSDCKNIILSGGYHLNCSNNFKLVKHFAGLNFFVDPIPYDGGTAVGAAYYCSNFKN